GSDGEGLDLSGLEFDFGGGIAGDGDRLSEGMEAEETPEVDSPLDEE
ncbi:MAG: hypothetical protein ICV71_09110, partial [Thermoleophilia bacterium]|nr:hypothetical protein [Thermoleophilia bacterium]